MWAGREKYRARDRSKKVGGKSMKAAMQEAGHTGRRGNLFAHVRLYLLSAAIAAGLSVAALPEAAAQGAPAVAPSNEIQEVLVTARRREESLQEVPIAITNVDSTTLANRNISSVGDLAGIVPNLKMGGGFFSGSSGSNYIIRGIPGVEVYMDGVSITASGGSLPTVVDIERVEVLRGPQGTLFGRNAIGGALQLITKKPTETFGGNVAVTIGDHDRKDVNGTINVPITDTLFAKITGSTQNRDGFVRSVKTGTEFGSIDENMGRLDFLWKPGSKFQARLQYTNLNVQSNGSPYVTFSFKSVCPGDPLPAKYLARDGRAVFQAPNTICLLQKANINYSQLSGTNALEFQTYGALEQYKNTVDDASLYKFFRDTNDVKLDLSYNLTDNWSLRSISSRRWGSGAAPSSNDGTGLELAYRSADIVTFFDTRTSELQLQYAGSRWAGTTGAYYERIPGFFTRTFAWLNTELLRPGIQAPVEAYLGFPVAQLSPNARPVLLGNSSSVANGQESTQWAGFTEWTFSATDKLKLTAGVRYTKQDRLTTSYSAAQVVNKQPSCCHLDSSVDYLAVTGTPRLLPTKFKQTTPRGSIQYQWTPDVMTYLTYSEGATTGGINNPPLALTGLQPYEFQPQKVKNYEFGVRSDLFGRRLRLNASVFYDDFQNIQVSEEIYAGIGVTNNAEGRIKGVEVEGIWNVLDNLTLNYGAALLDTEYTGLGTTLLLELGTPFAFAPDYSVDFGAEYRFTLGNRGSLAVRGDYTAQGATVNVVDRFNQGPIPATHLVSARATYTPTEGNWNIALSGTNLTNDFYWTNIFAPPGGQYTGGSLGRPREFALGFNIKF
jgi:iron complex outermembrane recepter protein